MNFRKVIGALVRDFQSWHSTNVLLLTILFFCPFALSVDGLHLLVSFEARDLVQKMMEPDPKNRIGAEDALKHPWIKNETMHLPNVATLSARGEEPTKLHCSVS